MKRHLSVLLLLLVACGDDTGTAPLLAECEKDDDCESGHCIENVDRSVSPFDLQGESDFRFCSEPCEGSCQGEGDVTGTCGFSGEGEGWCVFECNGQGQPPGDELDGFLCQRGTPVACGSVESPDCMVCGCDDGEYCQLTTRSCQPKSDMMGACSTHGECLSGHCNVMAGTCEQALGETCDESQCSECARLDDQSYCTQACSIDGHCPSGWRCIAFYMEDEFYCRKECASLDDACPLPNEECMEVPDFGFMACSR